jgi:hypothetical protein
MTIPLARALEFILAHRFIADPTSHHFEMTLI